MINSKRLKMSPLIQKSTHESYLSQQQSNPEDESDYYLSASEFEGAGSRSDSAKPVAGDSTGAPLNPTPNLKRFTKEEDDIILDGFSKFGAKWEDIAQWSSLNRTSNQIRGRFNRMIKRQVERKTKDSIFAPISMPATIVSPFPLVSTTANNNLNNLQNNTSGIDVASTSSSPGFVSKPLGLLLGEKGFACPSKLCEIVPCEHVDFKAIENLPTDAKMEIYLQRIKNLENVERSLKREQKLRKDLEKQNMELVNILNNLKNDASAAQSSFEKQIIHIKSVQKSKIETITSMYRGLLTERAIEDAKKVRQKLNEDSMRLASIKGELHNDEYKEFVQEGYAFNELYQKQARIMEEKKSIEERRKDLISRYSNDEKRNDPDYLRIMREEEEILKVRYSSLKKQEYELFALHESLLREKEIHLKEIRRVRDENASRFHSHPLMNNRYLLIRLIGKGGFSEVYLAFDLVEFREVACKIHQLNQSWSEAKKASYLKHAIREYTIHKQLNHPRIIKLLDVFEIDDQSFCSVLDYCKGSDLEKILQIHSTFTERESKCIIVQVVSAVKYLNELDPPVIHFDLKPANILFDQGEVKITDFGLSKIMEYVDDHTNPGADLTSPGAGTYWYLPPECFDSSSREHPTRITCKVDVWSIGVILYQMIYGKKPFGNDLSQQEILRHDIIKNAYCVYFPSKPAISLECKSFILRCLEYDQAKRPDIQTLWKDAFLQPKVSSSSIAAAASTGTAAPAPVNPSPTINNQ